MSFGNGRLECPVCLEQDRADRVWCRLPCDHAVCLGCLLKLRTKACPLCRLDLSTALSDTLFVSQTIAGSASETETSPGITDEAIARWRRMLLRRRPSADATTRD